MSRCFPFPPPGYKRNGTSSEALIESIKLQKEREGTREEQKKDKRKTKEKRKDKKDKKDRKERKEKKEKEGKATHAREGKGKESKLNIVESYHLGKIRAEPDGGCLQKAEYDENEQHERSGITEEHDQPFSSHEPCCLSDSTQSSNKRKRSNSPSSNDHGGTIFKIRLPLRKHKESEVSRLEYHSGSTSESIGTKDSITNETCKLSQCLRKSDSKHGKEYQNLIHDSAGVDDRYTNLIDNETRKIASVYNSLFQNLSSFSPQCDGIKLEDEDWLFSSERREERPTPKKAKSVNDAPRCSNPTLWPHAQYLPEADIYGLPYAVPF